MQFRRGTTTRLLGVILGTGMVLTIVSPWIVLSRLDLQQQQQLSPSHWIQNRIQSVSHHNKENFPSLDGYSCHDIFGIHQLNDTIFCRTRHEEVQTCKISAYKPEMPKPQLKGGIEKRDRSATSSAITLNLGQQLNWTIIYQAQWYTLVFFYLCISY